MKSDKMTQKVTRKIIRCLREIQQRGRLLNQNDVFNGKNPKTFVQMNGSYISARAKRLARLLGLKIEWPKRRV